MRGFVLQRVKELTVALVFWLAVAFVLAWVDGAL
jgi:hypothetical protein